MTKKLTLITTKVDRSVPLLLEESSQSISIDGPYFYEDHLTDSRIPTFRPDIVYLRDPFNSGIGAAFVKPVLIALLDQFSRIRIIDNISSIEDIFLEDKWLQFNRFRRYMPETQLLSAWTRGHQEDTLFKKRISSRAKGIFFTMPDAIDDSYIAQKRLDIAEEYRVIEVCKEILPLIIVKRPKTEHQTVKGLHAAPLQDDVKNFVKDLQALHSFELVGYDIARTTTNKLFLIEINRSPQLGRYFQLAGINPFRMLLSKLRCI